MSARCANRCRHAFTLIEILVATFCMAVLLAALAIPVRGALRERERASEAGEESLRLRRALDRVVVDLDGLLLPGTALTGQFVGTKNDTQDGRQDSLEFATASPTTQSGGCQRVTYEVVESENGEGYDWLRTRTLNPLSDDEDATVETTLLADIQSLELSYYDGTTWQESWDTSTSDGLPQAIAVLVSLALDEEDDESMESPSYRLVIPVLLEKAEAESQRGGEQ